MTDERLRNLLARLHERLNSTSDVDAEQRAMLQTVMQDIDRRLKGHPQGATDPSQRDPEGFPGSPMGTTGSPVTSEPAARTGPVPRLEALAVQFEADHLALAQLLRQLGALLG